LKEASETAADQMISLDLINKIPVDEGTKRSAAVGCSVLSAIAVPILVYIALLCTTESRLIEIPLADKPRAAVGAWIAAAMYGATFFYCYQFLHGTSSTRVTRADSETVPLTANRL
jgi:hypothetical protein